MCVDFEWLGFVLHLFEDSSNGGIISRYIVCSFGIDVRRVSLVSSSIIQDHHPDHRLDQRNFIFCIFAQIPLVYIHLESKVNMTYIF